MVQSGYSATLAGTSLGSLAGIESISIAGLELRFDEIATMETYNTGTATFTNGSDQVSGSGTSWATEMAGRSIQLDADGVYHEVESVEGATALTLTANYSDTGGSGAYTMLPNRVVTNLPLGIAEQAITVVFEWNKTVHNTLNAACLARTEDSFTVTDSETSTHIGDGIVARVGDMELGTSGHATFTAVLQPVTNWAFTPAA